LTPGRWPRRPVAYRARRSGALGVPLHRVRGARLRERARVLSLRSERQVGLRVHDSPQRERTLRAAADARRGALLARSLRRTAQPAVRGARAMTSRILGSLAGLLALMLGLMTIALWLGLGSPISSPPSFECVRASWKPSEISLLDRNGEVVHEQRADDKRRRL